MMSLSDDNQADVIDAFNTTSRCFDDILNIHYVYFDNMVTHFDNMVTQIYQLIKANTSDTEAAFLDCICQFLTLHHMESISLNSFFLLEHLALILTSTLAINC